MNPLKQRPNPSMFRDALFNFNEVQTGRILSETEVNEMNFIIKKRADRYISAAKEEWLYPEEKIPTQYWDRLGDGYLLMPDPRSMLFSGASTIGSASKQVERFDPYGRKPSQPGYNSQDNSDLEGNTFNAFQGEFARRFGPKRRGRSFNFDMLDPDEDAPDYHAHTISQEAVFKQKLPAKYRRGQKKQKP
jgi:hypothetical protein